MICVRIVLPFVGFIFFLVGILAITLGFAVPSSKNASLLKTDCTYVAYYIGPVETCSYSYGKGQTGHYDCVHWTVTVDVQNFGTHWIGGTSSHTTTIANELWGRYPINATVGCYFATDGTDTITFSYYEVNSGLIVGTLFLSLFGCTLIVYAIAEIVHCVKKYPSGSA